MFFITTFNKRLYDKYAHQFITSYVQTKQTIPLTCYVEEDFKYPQHENITYINLLKEMPEIVSFKERHKDKIWLDDTNFLQNAVRFCHKVFAQVHASYSEKKFMWLDADNQFHNKIPETFFQSFIPDDTLVSYYGRENYTECGVIGFNAKLELSKKFFDIYLSYYTKDKIWNLTDKTDCHAFDETRKQLLGTSGYKEIIKGDGRTGHVIARDKTINIYIDHKKGKRKFQRHSPEWEQHRR